MKGDAQCLCGRICVGLTVTESRNWNPDCPVHCVGSLWWDSAEQRQKRDERSTRVRDLQRQAAEAKARTSSSH